MVMPVSWKRHRVKKERYCVSPFIMHADSLVTVVAVVVVVGWLVGLGWLNCSVGATHNEYRWNLQRRSIPQVGIDA